MKTARRLLLHRFALFAAAVQWCSLVAPDTAVVELYRHSNHDLNRARSARNVLYYGTIRLGSHNASLNVCFDTGSADLWVPSQDCYVASCMAHTRYSYNTSTSFQPTASHFNIRYGTGAVWGRVALETVALARPQLRLLNQAVGMAVESSADFESASCDGIFGLALPALAKEGATPAFYRMVEQGLLDAPMFALWLSPDPVAEPAGSVQFGGHDRGRYVGTMHELPVISTKYWTVALTGVRVGEARAPGVAADGAVFDSGSTMIMASDADAAAINLAIPGMQREAESPSWRLVSGCGAVDGLPDIALELGSFEFVLMPRQYIIMVGDGEDAYCISAVTGGGLTRRVVLGDTFLRAFYTVYTYEPVSGAAWVALAPAALGDSGVHVGDSDAHVSDSGAPAGANLSAFKSPVGAAGLPDLAASGEPVLGVGPSRRVLGVTPHWHPHNWQSWAPPMAVPSRAQLARAAQTARDASL